MIRFETTIGPAGGGDKERILLQFYSTIVEQDFPEGRKFSGKELNEQFGKSLEKYRLRLESKRGREFAEKESARLGLIWGDYSAGINENKEYEVFDSVESLSYCELSDRERYFRF
jgi:hypothetical protein